MDRVQAITDLAEEENRELTAEEKTEIDGILDKQVPEVEAEIKRVEKIDAKMAELAASRSNSPAPQQAATPHLNAPNNERGSLAETIHVPASARRGCGTLKAYRISQNPHAVNEAYIAGMFLAAQLYGDKAARQWCGKHGIEIKDALSTGDNKLGGYVVVPEFEAAVTNLREQYGVFRANVGARPMGSDETSFPNVAKV